MICIYLVFSVRYDDSLSVLKIYLVVIGIREKSMFRAANTDVHLKYDEKLVQVFNMNKKSKPPKKTVLDTRYFEKSKLPGKVAKCEYKLKKDQCVLQIHKAVPGLWANALSL
uniref:DDE_Tnp_1_7 domain-containing protein n=1 Tax=Syphacia muris TaxID=451379 RepID=A0A158R4X3_9BILA